MKDRRIPKFVNEYTSNCQKKRGLTTEKMETPIRTKMEHAKNWLLYILLLLMMVNTKKDFEPRLASL
jgi:hypothetical protein